MHPNRVTMQVKSMLLRKHFVSGVVASKGMGRELTKGEEDMSQGDEGGRACV